eukprot:gnl/TRDRNA2_/TRDRNA2_177994_c0_seq1.p1 gnl/TRDRNA2_/TRDRNA2_177994_c0~~gnl/TRDRNA2_/TRDRNA2_177994_c0_seq1.p1  ORF type:complete len:190 (+),score=57.81 gnl/TRDRNA2_/TRDRNA2_177994_c0_seq1:730-1299(+)
MDKVSNSSAVATLKNGKATATKKLEVARKSIAEGQRAIVVKCHIICERSGLIELKEITVEKMDQLQVVAVRAAKSGCNSAYMITKRVAGNERATIIFTKIGEKVPLVKSAICPEASTGSFEAAAAPAPGRQAGTGDTGAALQMPEVQQLMEEPQLRQPEAMKTGLPGLHQGLTGFADLPAKLQAFAEAQ